MATLTAPVDNILNDADQVTFNAAVKTNVDALYASVGNVVNYTNIGAVVAVTDAANYAVLAANSNKLHVVPDCSQGTTMTLPTAAAGLTYEFIYGGAAADASNHIFIPTAAAFFIGGVTFHDAQADATTSVWSDGNSNDVFTIVTPGTYSVKFVCNGTNWYVTGNICGATVCTMAD
jgi:hypothetical protein